MNNITNLQTARKLMTYADNFARRKEDPNARTVSAREMMEQDEVILSQANKTEEAQPARQTVQQLDLKIAEIHKYSYQQEIRQTLVVGEDGQTAKKETEIETREVFSSEFALEISTWEDVEGLVLRDKKYAETDRYQFEFRSGTELIILDKWTLRSTRIWGDPHIDLNDLQGQDNGDFKDLKASNTLTTFMLQDSTRVTVTAEDTGVIEKVDIFKGKQHLSGYGYASEKWHEDSKLFDPEVKEDGFEAGIALRKGDVIYAGGDGNDWYNGSGLLIWGKKTGPSVNSKPRYDLSMSIQQTVEARSKIKLIETQA